MSMRRVLRSGAASCTVLLAATILGTPCRAGLVPDGSLDDDSSVGPLGLASSWWQHGDFLAEVGYPTAVSASAVAAGDLDRDGLPDLISLGLRSPFPGFPIVNVIQNLGGGRLANRAAVDLNGQAGGLTVADLNEDGWPDVAVAVFHPDNVSVLFNDGHGGLQAPLVLGASNAPIDVTAGDLDGDGHTDLIAVHRFPNPSLSIFWNGGTGTFSPADPVSIGGFARSPILADLDHDGDPDIAATVGDFVSRRFAILTNIGRRVFALPTLYEAGTTPSAMAAGDVDLDGDLDFAVGDLLGGIYVFRNDGNGRFDQREKRETQAPVSAVCIAEVNGDRWPEVVGASDWSLLVFRNFQGRSFCSPERWGIGNDTSTLLALDIDEDAAIDLVTPFSIVFNKGDGSLAARLPSATAGPSVHAIGADLDNDGDSDLVTANGNANSVSVLSNGGYGRFGTPSTHAVGADSRSVAASDFDRDGFMDLVSANTGDHSVTLLRNEGRRGFARWRDVRVGQSPVAVIAGDLDRDGLPDIAVANRAATFVSILLNDSDHSFTVHREYTIGPNPRALIGGDFNGDGVRDLAVLSSAVDGSAGSLVVLKNNGFGGFSAHHSFPISARSEYLASGDFDEDGDLDFATTDGSSVVMFLENRGDGTIERATPQSTSVRFPGAMAAADFDGDGVTELAVAEGGFGHSVSILRFMDYRFSRLYAAGFPTALVAQDFDGGGAADLVAVSWIRSEASVFLNARDSQPGRVVDVQVRPRATEPILNPGGRVPIAVFGSEGFDPGLLNPATVRLAGAGLYEHPSGKNSSSLEDVNRDRIEDLSMDVQGDELIVGEDDLDLLMEARTWQGVPVRGYAAFRRVPPPRLESPDRRDLTHTTSLEAASAPPAFLRQIAPSDRLVLEYRLPSPIPGRLEVMDVSGRRVWARALPVQGPDAHRIDLKGERAWKPGVYFLRITGGSQVLRAKAVVLF